MKKKGVFITVFCVLLVGLLALCIFRPGRNQEMASTALGQYRTNEVVGARVNFLLASLAKIEGLPGVNQDFCRLTG